MDSTLLTAVAAGLGSLAGASATIVTALLTQRTQVLRATSEWQLHVRETLYGEFITEASRLSIDALMNSLDRPDRLVVLYGILSRIRLIAGEEVLRNAEACSRQILEAYRQPNMSSDEIRAAFDSKGLDPLKDFSAACRTELLGLSSQSSSFGSVKFKVVPEIANDTLATVR
jgi:hypothetical protein